MSLVKISFALNLKWGLVVLLHRHQAGDDGLQEFSEGGLCETWQEKLDETEGRLDDLTWLWRQKDTGVVDFYLQ